MTKRAAKISDAARAFMVAAETAPPLPTDLSYPEQRRLVREGYAPASEQAIFRHKVTLEEIEIAGVRCTRVSPRDPKTDRQILYMFGGGFCVGSLYEDMPIIAHLAASLECNVICPHYRLAPEHPFPAALNDVEIVAAELLGGQVKTAIAGESAGGNLTLALYQRLRRKSAPMPVAMAIMSPATDLSDIGDSGAADRDPLLSAARVTEVNSIYPVDIDLTDPEVSPIYGAYDATTPPTFITTGTRDLFLSNCVRMERVMRTSGADVTLRVWEGMGHVFEFFPEMPEGDESLEEIAGFLEKHLAG